MQFKIQPYFNQCISLSIDENPITFIVSVDPTPEDFEGLILTAPAGEPLPTLEEVAVVVNSTYAVTTSQSLFDTITCEDVVLTSDNEIDWGHLKAVYDIDMVQEIIV